MKNNFFQTDSSGDDSRNYIAYRLYRFNGCKVWVLERHKDALAAYLRETGYFLNLKRYSS